jgi:hypothetical protein
VHALRAGGDRIAHELADVLDRYDPGAFRGDGNDERTAASFGP